MKKKDEQKHTDSQIRAIIIKKAREFTRDNIDYLDKNSNITNDQCVKIICNFHIHSKIIQDNFVRIVNKHIAKIQPMPEPNGYQQYK